jgi:hypothetical protein
MKSTYLPTFFKREKNKIWVEDGPIKEIVYVIDYFNVITHLFFSEVFLCLK